VHARRGLRLAAAGILSAALSLAGCRPASAPGQAGAPVGAGQGFSATASLSSPAPSRSVRSPGGARALAASLVAVHDPGRVTGTLAGPCHARDHGRLPDPRCTPGAIDPAVTQADIHSTICAAGYTATVRPPASQTGSFKFGEAYPAYGLTAGTESELDHLVPLELGGANDAANLWPEAGAIPNPKDAVEDALHQAVCDGRITLARAQRAIARNWETAAALVGPGAAPAQARSTAPAAAAGLSCGATVSDATPADYTTVDVIVRTTAGATVTTVAHYKTTDHRKTGTADASGRAVTAYYISGATPGYTVTVDVTVTAGSRAAHCSASFTPVR
jgi:hypothetical protein